MLDAIPPGQLQVTQPNDKLQRAFTVASKLPPNSRKMRLIPAAAAFFGYLGLLPSVLSLVKKLGISFACCEKPRAVGGDAQQVKDDVRDTYSSIAERTQMGERSTETSDKVAAAFGYSAEELADIPGNQGLSCGNPIAQASLKPGESVLDLGCGAGFDVFLAARRVGSSGRVVGVDISQPMIALAEDNLRKRREREEKEAEGSPEIEFVLSDIDAMPLQSESMDCAISNCVLNLVPDKRCTFSELHRVLRCGGRLAVSDIIQRRPLPVESLPAALRPFALSGCLSGAICEEEYRAALEQAGFSAVQIVDKKVDMNVWKEREMLRDFMQGGCCGGDGIGLNDSLLDMAAEVTTGLDLNEYIASAYVFALKQHPRLDIKHGDVQLSAPRC